MNARNAVLAATAAMTLGIAGCAGDVSQQVVSNEQVRTQVLDALATHKDLALKTVDRLMASDSVRTAVVDEMLKNEEGAKQVLIRIGTNPAALDLVMSVAIRDTATREHVIGLAKGIEMATAKK
jgi:hypothetical protein